MSAQLLSSKIVIIEEEPRIRGVPALPTAIVGCVGVTERGPFTATLVSSFEEYVSVYGGFTANGDVVTAAFGFFLNGGEQMWVVRTVHYTDPSTPATKTSAAATIDLSDVSPAVTATVDGKTDGTYGNNLSIKISAATDGESDHWNLSVLDDGVVVEVFPNLSFTAADENFSETVINSEATGSKLIKYTEVLVTRPVDGTFGPMTGGDDGLIGIVDADYIGAEPGDTGLFALDIVINLTLLIVPGVATSGVHNAMITYVEVTRDGRMFAVLDPPSGETASEIVTYVETTAAILNLSEYAVIYWPRVKIINPDRGVYGNVDQITVPPSGFVCGVYARTDTAQPGGVYQPPAGIERGVIFGVVGFEDDPNGKPEHEVVDEKKRDIVFPKRINPITAFEGTPRHIDGSRTLKGNGNFPYVAERRGVIFIENTLRVGLLFAKHSNNTPKLRARVRRTITSFLIDQMKNDAFRSQNPSTAFFVDVSGGLNPTVDQFSGKLTARVGLATNKPAEFIILLIAQDTRALEEEIEAAAA